MLSYVATFYSKNDFCTGAFLSLERYYRIAGKSFKTSLKEIMLVKRKKRRTADDFNTEFDFNDFVVESTHDSWQEAKALAKARSFKSDATTSLDDKIAFVRRTHSGNEERVG